MYHEPSALERFMYGLVFLGVYFISLTLAAATFQIMKYSIKRKRPEPVEGTNRIGGNLRKAEAGTYSMPSGDVSACSLYCFLFASVMGIPAVYVVLPLVMAGRVFY